MFHVLVEVEGRAKRGGAAVPNERHAEFDIVDRASVIRDFVLPYVREEALIIDGFRVKHGDECRFLVTRTSHRASEMTKAQNNAVPDEIFVVFMDVDVVFDTRIALDVTRELLSEARASVNTAHGVVAPRGRQGPDASSVFIAYSYRDEDEELVEGMRHMLEDKGFSLTDGKADRLGSISGAILDKISNAAATIVVMTKRDLKANGKYTTAAWLLEEKGAALALGRRVTMFVEDGVDEDDIGGLQGDDQRFHFNRNNFASKVMSFLRAAKATRQS